MRDPTNPDPTHPRSCLLTRNATLVVERLLSAKRLPKVNTMGDAKFDKFSTGFDGNSETWLEFSYYSFQQVID